MFCINIKKMGGPIPDEMSNQWILLVLDQSAVITFANFTNWQNHAKEVT